MFTYLARRILLAVPTLFGITVVTFAIINLAPGDPAPLTYAAETIRGAPLPVQAIVS